MQKYIIIVLLTILLFFTKAGEVGAQKDSPILSSQYLSSKDINNEVCYTTLSSMLLCGSVKAENTQYLSTADKILRAASDERAKKLRAYFAKHNSPLEPHAYDFVYYADLYDLDWKLVPAIAGVESTFGKRIPPNSYNAYGWANGAYKFTSWEHSIEHVSRTLRTKYYDRGLDTVPKIAKVYAPPSQTWGGNVQFFMNKIENFEPEL